MNDYIEIKNFLNIDTCKTIIEKFEELKSQTIKFNNRLVLRCNDIDDLVINQLRNKIKNYFDSKFKNHFLRNLEIAFWNIGEKHLEHIDTPYYDYTIIINLSDDYEGARTHVKTQSIEPEIGKLIYFNADKPHSVSELTKGKRYVILAWYNNKENQN
jgi:predicted 2-oxoglutarate/Fe(II)-dependent dioxygenase YbiX